MYQAHPKPSNLISPVHPTLVIDSFIITETSPVGTRRGFPGPVSGYQGCSGLAMCLGMLLCLPASPTLGLAYHVLVSVWPFSSHEYPRPGVLNVWRSMCAGCSGQGNSSNRVLIHVTRTLDR